MSTKQLKRAIFLAGGQTNLAKQVGLSQPYIWNWLNRDRCVPAEFVIPVCKATSWEVTPNQLRPDIYPNQSDGIPTPKSGKAA